MVTASKKELDGLSWYAKRFPKPKNTGNMHIDIEKQSERLQAMQVVEMLVKDASLAGPIAGLVAAASSTVHGKSNALQESNKKRRPTEKQRAACRSNLQKARQARKAWFDKKKTSPLHGLRLPKVVPQGDLEKADLKRLLPPGALIWKGPAGNWQGWGGKSWNLAGSQRAAALDVLQHTWRLWLEDRGLNEQHCPIQGIFTSSGSGL